MTNQATITAPAAEILNLPLADLILSDLNPRQDADEAGIAALAASIKAVGLMQNLSGFSGEAEGKTAVVAGGRRLRALRLLAEAGDAPDFVPVRVTADRETALLWANTENTAREDLHPADEIRAYYRMLAEGQATVADVASAFAVTEAHVRRRARLGALPDPVIDALKAGKITIGHAQAMTVAQNEDVLLAALEKLTTAYSPRAFTEYDVRRMVTPEAINARDRRLVFVGREAYDAAGGKSTVDLFEGAAVLHSPDILDRVFAEKLEEAADVRSAQGWKWVKTIAEPQPDWSEVNIAARLYREEGELTEEQAARYDELCGLFEQNALAEDESNELDALQAILEGDYSATQRANSGLLIYVGYQGDLSESAGIVLPEDVEGAVAAELFAPVSVTPSSPTSTTEEPAKSALSQALLTDLQAMRSAAVQGALLDKPKLALDLLAFALSERFGPLDMHYHASNISPTEAEGFAPDPRLAGIEDDGDSEGNPFAAFRAKGEKHRNAALALITARSLKYDAQAWGKGERFNIFDDLEDELKANIRQVWTPTAANFFGRVNAAYLEKLLADLTGCDRNGPEFKGFAAGKKKEKASMLERLFSDAETQKLWKVSAEQKAQIDEWVPAEL